MRIGKIGSEHNTHLHNVSNCVHESPETDKKTGGMTKAYMQKSMDSVQISYQGTQMEENVQTAGWLSRLSGGIKKLFLSLWEGSSAQKESTVESSKQEMTHTAEAISAYPSEKTQQVSAVNGTPYFKPVDGIYAGRTNNLTQFMKNKIHEVTGYLAKHFSFSGRNGFDTGRQRPKDDLRKRSRYRENDIEMDCTLTDDSYLLDSYDRKGGYSQLSTKL